MKVFNIKQGLKALYVIVLISLLPLKPVMAQKTAPVQLSDALKEIMAYHQVNFMYEEVNISRKKVSFSTAVLKEKGLDEVLTMVLEQAGLKWSRIDKKNYAIFLPAAVKKDLLAKESIPPWKGAIADSLVQINTTDSLLNKMSPTQLNEVKIISNKATVERRSDRLVYNVENSAMAAGNSIELLKTAPFVRVGSDNTVSLQGKATMILIDNKPVAESSLQSILQSLPAGNISQIELITNPSAKYDAAYGAVINIVTKKSKIEGLTGNVRADASSGKYATGMSNASLTYKHKGLTLYGTGGFTYGDSYFATDEDRFVGLTNNTAFLSNKWSRKTLQSVGAYQAGADLEIGSGQTIGFIADGNIMHFKGPWNTVNGFRSGFSSGIDSLLYTNATFGQPVFMGNFNLNYHLTADSGKRELTVLATYTPFRRDLKQDFPSVLKDAEGKVLNTPPLYRTRNKTAIDVYIAQADYSQSFGRQWKLETGLKYQQTASENEIYYEEANGNDFINVPRYSSNNRLKESITGMYLIASKDWKSDKLQLGLRGENTQAAFVGNFEQHSFNLFPTVLYQHSFSEQQKISFSYKRTIARAPYYELVPYSVFLNKYTVEQGNPALRPTYNNIFTLGTDINKVNISLSYTAITDMMALFPVREDIDTKLTYFSRRNLEKAYDYSMYLYFPLRLAPWWETQNSGTILGYNKTEGKALDATYSLAAFHSDFKSSQIFRLGKGFKLQVDAYYWTKYAQDLTSYSGFKNMDAALLIDLFGGKGQLRLGGQELFKRNDYSQSRQFGNYRISNVIYTDSRRASFGFTYKFGKTNIKSPEKNLGNEDAMKRL